MSAEKRSKIIKSKSHYRAKELSWLSFNARLLQEAQDPTVPLFERLRFLGIFSSNLDEFFRVRVAALSRFAALGGRAKAIFGQNPGKLLKEVQQVVRDLTRRFEDIYQDLLTELAQHDVYILDERQLDEDQGEFVRGYFRREVRPKLVPIMLDQAKVFPELRDGRPYLAVEMSDKRAQGKPQYALIEIPTTIRSRFLVLPQKGKNRYVILLDDVIRAGLSDIFAPFDFGRIEAYMIKLTRDSELDVEDDVTQSFVKKLSRSLRQRKTGDPVRFVYDADLPLPLLKLLINRLELGPEDTLMPGARYHNFRDFVRFPDFGSPRFYYEPVEILSHPQFPSGHRVMEAMREQDILVHYPYQSFEHVIDLLREASIDPKVQSIKFTIYRAARTSSVVNALINAAKNGKAVVAVVELQARFDEEANLYWGDQLQEAGVKVIYGVPGLKVHSKLCLISRREGQKSMRYGIVGTGNFNEDTAKVYSDHTLFTADPRITGEIHKVFRFYERNYQIPEFKHLLVSPFDMRKKFLRLIANETRNAQAGKPAEIILKLNNLVDAEVISSLCRASQAGVKVRLIVRSMFSLVTEISGVSDQIEALSIVDKYLEHSRIFVFHNDGKPLYFISSSDLMRRNLDKRVEVTCPIYDKRIQEELQKFLDIQFADNVKARVLNRELDNPIREGAPEKSVRAQFAIYEYLRQRTVPPDQAVKNKEGAAA